MKAVPCDSWIATPSARNDEADFDSVSSDRSLAPLIRKFFNKNPMGAPLKVVFLPQGLEKLRLNKKKLYQFY